MTKSVTFAEYNMMRYIPHVPGTHKMGIPPSNCTVFSPKKLEKEIASRKRAELKRLVRQISEFGREIASINDDDERLCELTVILANCHLKLSLLRQK